MNYFLMWTGVSLRGSRTVWDGYSIICICADTSDITRTTPIWAEGKNSPNSSMHCGINIGARVEKIKNKDRSLYTLFSTVHLSKYHTFQSAI
jgi:hypothetical protein